MPRKTLQLDQSYRDWPVTHLVNSRASKMLSSSVKASWASKAASVGGRGAHRHATSLKPQRSSSASKRSIITDYKKEDVYSKRMSSPILLLDMPEDSGYDIKLQQTNVTLLSL